MTTAQQRHRLKMERKKLEREQRSLQNERIELARADAPKPERQREIEDRHVAINGELDRIDGELDKLPNDQRSAEQREADALVAGYDLGAVAAMVTGERRSLDGPTAEYNAERNIPDGQFSIRALAVETRAATTVPASVSVAERPLIYGPFATGDAAFFGIAPEIVEVGTAGYPVLTSDPSVKGPFTDSTDATETNGVIALYSLPPERVQAGFRYRRTDAARFAGLDTGLREALREALGAAFDAQVVAQIVADVNRTAANAADTFATVFSRFVYPNVDGTYAADEAALRIMVGADTLTDWAALYRTNNSDASSVAAVRALVGGLRVSANIPDTAANKQDVLIRKGGNQDFAAAVWENVELVEDRVSAVGTGEVKLTAIMLAAWDVLRSDGFVRVQAQHQ